MFEVGQKVCISKRTEWEANNEPMPYYMTGIIENKVSSPCKNVEILLIAEKFIGENECVYDVIDADGNIFIGFSERELKPYEAVKGSLLTECELTKENAMREEVERLIGRIEHIDLSELTYSQALRINKVLDEVN